MSPAGPAEAARAARLKIAVWREGYPGRVPARARAFYGRLGWRATGERQGAVFAPREVFEVRHVLPPDKLSGT